MELDSGAPVDCDAGVPDIYVVTSRGRLIPAQSQILASASPVLQNIIHRPRKNQNAERNIPILGVPCDAVSAFVQFLHSSTCSEEEIEKYGIHLLALSHVYSVPPLKQMCTRALAEQLTVDNVVDVLQLARLCDAPNLYVKCMNLLVHNFKTVEETEGWKFLQNHDPYLELDVLQFISEFELRKKRRRKYREEQSLYTELSEAMECLEHICSEGCTSITPYDVDATTRKVPCSKYSTCHGLQLLIKHFGTCKRRANGGCIRCKRLWQLFRLHASVCEQPDHECKVPLCRQLKSKMLQEEGRGNDDGRWGLLVRKVYAARAISSLSLS